MSVKEEREKREKELWVYYLRVWRQVLIGVLDWSPAAVEDWIEEQRRFRDSKNPEWDFSFFYDLPAHYLFLPILGNGLHDRIMREDGVNPTEAWIELTKAIFDGRMDLRDESEDFDWKAAKERYLTCRKKIEAQLK